MGTDETEIRRRTRGTDDCGEADAFEVAFAKYHY
jgi:hypothetical protein